MIVYFLINGFFFRSKTVDPSTGISYTHYESTWLPRKGTVWREGKHKPYTVRNIPKRPEPWYRSYFHAKGHKILHPKKQKTRRKKKSWF